MLGKICGFISVMSFIFGLFNGRLKEMGQGIIDGASNAVVLTMSLAGAMCLWMGIMQVAAASGITDKISSALSPLLKLLFPDAYKKNNGTGEIAASVTANVFGIGNAATPLAIKAMEKLQENNGGENTASDDMVMFTVLGTASVDIFPTTLIAMRQAAGSGNVFEIIIPVWICSVMTAAFGVLTVKMFCVLKKKNRLYNIYNK